MTNDKRADDNALITEASAGAVRDRLDRLPVRPGNARVWCVGCGTAVVVTAGAERHAVVEMQAHAHGHADQLSDAFRATAKDDLPADQRPGWHLHLDPAGGRLAELTRTHDEHDEQPRPRTRT